MIVVFLFWQIIKLVYNSTNIGMVKTGQTAAATYLFAYHPDTEYNFLLDSHGDV